MSNKMKAFLEEMKQAFVMIGKDLFSTLVAVPAFKRMAAILAGVNDRLQAWLHEILAIS